MKSVEKTAFQEQQTNKYITISAAWSAVNKLNCGLISPQIFQVFMLRAVLDRHRYEVHNTYIDSFCAECDKFFEGEYTTLTLTLSVLNVTSS